MTGVYSLRMRLIVIILIPLLIVLSFVSFWQLQNAQRTANDVFDRGLLTAALAVSNDVAVSDGDALSPPTALLLEDSSGGPVFYHVYAPDGVIVAGYATPPVGLPPAGIRLEAPRTFEGSYHGRAVSGVQIQTQTEVEGFSGIFTTTVWQDRSLRDAFVRDLLVRTLMGLGAVLASLCVIVWFGVRVGLRPLTQLEQAIDRRSSDDLSEIRRAVPVEVKGIVQRLNDLFRQVGGTLDAQSQFIANASHQLRNPIAGVLSLAEAVDRAQTPEDVKIRTRDLLDATRKTADLTQRLLLHERARAISPKESFRTQKARMLVQEWADEFAERVPAPIGFTQDIELDDRLEINADHVMLKEALSNLIDNALNHGGKNLSCLTMGARQRGRSLHLWIADDGVGIAPEALETAMTRFAQVGTGEGSGLGLSIAQAIAEAHGGTLTLSPNPVGLRAQITLPLARASSP